MKEKINKMKHAFEISVMEYCFCLRYKILNIWSPMQVMQILGIQSLLLRELLLVTVISTLLWIKCKPDKTKINGIHFKQCMNIWILSKIEDYCWTRSLNPCTSPRTGYMSGYQRLHLHLRNRIVWSHMHLRWNEPSHMAAVIHKCLNPFWNEVKPDQRKIKSNTLQVWILKTPRMEYFCHR